jgi:hypothetical protein
MKKNKTPNSLKTPRYVFAATKDKNYYIGSFVRLDASMQRKETPSRPQVCVPPRARPDRSQPSFQQKNRHETFSF